MTQEIIPFNGDRNHLVAQWPSAVPGTVAKLAIAKAVAKAAETAVYTLSAARYAIVRVLTETSVQVELLNEERRVIREDIIPVLAVYRAHKQGRRAVGAMGLDRDHYENAMDDLDRKLQQRRDQW